MEQIARYKPGDNLPGFAVTAVLAGRFVKVVATKTAQGDYSIGHCGAGERPLGVAEQDSAAATEPAHSNERRVNVTRPGSVARVLVGADITAGAAVASDVAGKAVPAAADDVIAGYAMHTADFDASPVPYLEVDLTCSGAVLPA